MVFSQVLLIGILMLVVLVSLGYCCVVLLRDDCPNYESNYQTVCSVVNFLAKLVIPLCMLYVLVQMFLLF